MKIGRNKLSADQKRVIGGLYTTETCVQVWHSGADAIEAIKTWLENLGWEHERL